MDILKSIVRFLPKCLRKQIINFKILAVDYGQFRTIKNWTCKDRKGNYIPWYTYPAIEYLTQLDFSEYSVFEFGSGCSTLFWAKRVKKIISVEDNKKWHEKIRDLAKSGIPNLDYLFTENENEYAGYLSQYAEPFDIIIIDGVWRGRCAENAVAHIKKHGGKLLVLDNSDWYPNTVKFIRKELDWLQVDLHGFGPINNYTWTTSIFFNRNSKDNLIFPSIAHSQHWINHRAEDDLAGDRK